MKLFNFNTFVAHINESSNLDMLNEAFNSTILQRITTNNDRGGIDKRFFDLLSKMGISAHDVTNNDITVISPAEAAKYTAANPTHILIYYSNDEKPNPYVSRDGSYSYGTIKANTVLAVVKGKVYMGLKYDRYASKGGKADFTIVPDKDATHELGIGDKTGRGSGTSGLHTLSKMADVTDVVYVINPDTIPSSKQIRADRKESKEGATAFLDDKQFRSLNQSRYNAILRDRASKDDIDQIVQDAIDMLASQIKDGITSKAKNQYGEIILGTNPKGREIKMSDAGNLMNSIIRDYGYYADAKNTAEESQNKHNEIDKYHLNRAAEYAKTIKNHLVKVKDKNYAW